MSETHQGSCFCGAVTIEVSGDPVGEGYCHCADCRAWSAGPITAYGLWPAPAVKVTAGGDKLGTFSKTGTTNRRGCTVCGGVMMAEIPEAGLIDVFPTLLKSREFRPQAHVHYAARVLDIADGLPKFADLPEEAGGTGQMVPD